eukprot:1161928-Pelagomonas_calceolata.AAC.4
MSCHAIVQSLPHKQRVARLYRYGLRELLNYSANRQHWYPRAFALRAEFEANRAEVCLPIAAGCTINDLTEAS